MATTGKLIRNKKGAVVSNVTTSNDRAIARGKGQTSSKSPSIRQKAISKTANAMEKTSQAFGEANILTKGRIPSTHGGKNLAAAKWSLKNTGRKDKSPWERKGQGT